MGVHAAGVCGVVKHSVDMHGTDVHGVGVHAVVVHEAKTLTARKSTLWKVKIFISWRKTNH